MIEAINNIETQNPSGRGLFGLLIYFIAGDYQDVATHDKSGRGIFYVFYCKRPCITMKYRIKVVVVSSILCILFLETINKVLTQTHSTRGLFSVFYCMRPSTTLQHRIILALASLVYFNACGHQQH